MIAWKEKEPDFRVRKTVDGLRLMPFAAAISVIFTRTPHVCIPDTVRTKIYRHLSEQPVEMGGLLLGNVYGEDTAEPRVISIEDAVAASNFSGTRVSLSMSSDVWTKANLKAAGTHFVVGWYHSHPNLGVFFSSTDRATQKAFFANPHSLGLVVDPIRDEEMWFVGGDSRQIQADKVVYV